MRDKGPDFINVYAREVNGMPEGWHWVKLDAGESAGGYVKVEGAVMPRKRGNGVPDWKNRERGTEAMFQVKHVEFKVWCEQYAARFSKCDNCWGSGQEVASISVNTGTTYRTCGKCNGTGKPRVAEPAQVQAVPAP